MKGRKGTFLFTMLWASLAVGIFSCDTANNVEDPGLHYFVKYYGGNGNQKGVDMLALSDGTFLLLGNYSEFNFESDIYVVHVDALGKVLWERRYSKKDITNANITNARDIEPTGDGNFIILSDFQKNIGSQTDLKLIKISPDGTLLDSSDVFGSPAPVNDYGRTVTPIDDGGFIVSGTTVPDPPFDNGNFINYRFNSDLDQLSEIEWGLNSPSFDGKTDVAVKAIQRPGELLEQFYVFGYTNSNPDDNNPRGTSGLFYFSRRSDGEPVSTHFPGNIVPENNTEIQFVDRVSPALGDGFIVVGTSQNQMDDSEIFIAKLRSSLVFEKQDDFNFHEIIKLGRNIRGVSAASSVTGSYGYLVLGNEVRGTGALNIWLTKIDQGRNILWSSTFGSEAGDDSGAAVVELPDGKIVVLGTMGLADNQFKMALIKLNPQGELLK